VPVHIWHGDEDRSVADEYAHMMHEAVPGSVLHELPGAGHMFIYDRLGEIGLALTQG
jgi:pimeloyl-ACP methyl ester carboxylesterase